MLRWHQLISTTCAILLATSASATAEQRTLYQTAKDAFIRKDNVQADAITRQLDGYSLHPYLQVRQLTRDIEQTPDSRLRAFVMQHKPAPFAKSLQKTRLDHLFKQQRYSAYQRALKDWPLKGAKYQCQQAQAAYKTGQKQQALQQAAELWQVGHSQDKACDTLFSYWMQAGYPTAMQARTRFWKAAEAKNFSIARYAERFMKAADKKDTALLWQVKKDPNLLENPSLLQADNSYQGIIAAYGIRQLARKDLASALKIWLRDRHRLAIDQLTEEQLNHYFGMRYAKDFRPGASRVLAQLDPHFKQEELTEWRIRLELADQNWQGALNLINQLPSELQQSTRWRYWQEASRHRLNPDLYRPDYSKVVAERDFYGFLASEVSDAPFRLNHRAPSVTVADKQALADRPAMQRMKELLALNYHYAARREWNALIGQLSRPQQHAAAHLVSDWGWHNQAIRGAAYLKAWNDLDIRFPNPYPELFKAWAKTRGINPTWPVAVARQESAFDHYATSRVGARGLMQLMPATAKLTAKKFQVDYQHRQQLFEPNTNIALGTAYLAEMLERFSGNRAYASAAYNAGPHRVKRWLKARGHLPLDVWIETIPFDETRNYVQNVLAFNVIYDALASRPARLLNTTESATLALNR